MNRKNVGSRQGGIFSRLVDFLAGEKPASIQKAKIAHQTGASMADYSPEYDNTPLSGDRYVNGRCFRTVGEAKAASREIDAKGNYC